ncbi:MAG: glycosyltransferase family 9 protein [Pseudomonadota bacterium]|nr:glycosyltransferase family 9 protein [Pseudomonadota bacterium]
MNILVIKLGALGDFVQAFDAFAAIRARHPDEHITLLTTAPFAEIGERSPWFDRVLVDARPGWLNLPGILRLRRMLQGFDFVFDLQTSGRSARYFWLAGRPPWSGIARGASHPHTNKARDRMHNAERLREQLVMAGVREFPRADLSWFTPGGPALPKPYALLVPGCSPHLSEKRWPTERFGEFARLIADRGVLPVVVGTKSERDLGATIRAACPAARDLTGQTSLFDLAGVAARASLAVGNDTGPIHLAAAVGCPCIALFSARSDPGHAAPRGPVPGSVTVLREADLADLSLERVAACLP